MTLKSSEVRVAGTGELFLAPSGSTLPDDSDTALDVAFVGYGYTTEDGVTLTKAVNRDGIPAWQSLTPVRYLMTSQELTVACTFLQSNDKVLKLWLGSGDFAGTTPDWAADVPIDPVDLTFSMVLEWHDDTIASRLVVPKCQISETGDVAIARAATTFPVTFAAIAPDSGTVLASWLTNDPAFDPAA